MMASFVKLLLDRAQQQAQIRGTRKTRPPTERPRLKVYQMYFAASAIRTMATIANMTIWTAMLRLFFSTCAVM